MGLIKTLRGVGKPDIGVFGKLLQNILPDFLLCCALSPGGAQVTDCQHNSTFYDPQIYNRGEFVIYNKLPECGLHSAKNRRLKSALQFTVRI